MATALIEAGLKAEDLTSLAAFVRPENAKAILLFFIKRRGGKTSEAIYSHACLLKVIARAWVGNDSDFAAIEKLGRNIRNDLKKGGKRRGMKQRNIDRLRQFEDPRNRDAILGLPSRLMRQAAQLETGIADSATLALYGAAIEILIVTAMRIKNLTGLKIKDNLIMPLDPKGQAVISVPGEDVKNSNPIEIKLPVTSTALLQKYLKNFRPNLSENPSPWLFPNRSGQRRNIVGFSACISDVIYRHTGLVMHVHLFRHFALMMLERARPGSAEVGRRFLGHSHIQTTLNSYAQNGTHEAHKLFESVIESHRANLRLDLGEQP